MGMVGHFFSHLSFLFSFSLSLGDVPISTEIGGGRVVRWCWINFQCRGVLLIWIRVGQGPIALAVGTGRGLFGHFVSSLSFLYSFFLSLGHGPI